ARCSGRRRAARWRAAGQRPVPAVLWPGPPACVVVVVATPAFFVGAATTMANAWPGAAPGPRMWRGGGRRGRGRGGPLVAAREVGVTVTSAAMPGVMSDARPQIIRALNEQLQLGHIRDRGPCSRADLARLSGLSKPTVSLAPATVEQAGLVREAGQRIGRPGRS